MTDILNAALHVRDLQESADRAEVHGDTVQFLHSLRALAIARAELEQLGVDARREALS